MKWEKKKVSDVCELSYGKSLAAPVRVPGEFPVYGSAGEVGTHINYLVEGPGIVIGRKGSVGTVYYEKRNFFPIDTSYYVVPKPENHLRFLYYKLQTLGLEKLNSDAAVPGLNRNVAYEQSSIYPPLTTQRKIASILSAYDDLIENNMKRIKLLEEKAFLSYKLLEKSNKFKLDDLYDTSSGGTPSRTNAEYFTGDINWFKSKELADSILLESEEKITEQAIDKSSAKLFPVGSVIMAMYGATIGKLGMLSQPSTTNQACCAIIQKDELRSNFYILNWLLENREYVLSFRMGAAQENISQHVIKNLLVSIPKASDLKIFNSEMKPIYQLIKNLHQQNTKLREARDILLPRLMNGQIEV